MSAQVSPQRQKNKDTCRVAASRPKALAMVLRMGTPPSPSCTWRCHPILD